MTPLQERNRLVKAALRRIAAERRDLLAIACLNPRPRPDLAAMWPADYRAWTEAELREAFGR